MGLDNKQIQIPKYSFLSLVAAFVVGGIVTLEGALMVECKGTHMKNYTEAMIEAQNPLNPPEVRAACNQYAIKELQRSHEIPIFINPFRREYEDKPYEIIQSSARLKNRLNI